MRSFLLEDLPELLRFSLWLKNYSTTKKASKGINPDKTIAYGAAIQAGVLSGGRTQAILSFLTLTLSPTESLRSKTVGGVMTKLAARNTDEQIPNPSVRENLSQVFEGWRRRRKRTPL